MLKRQLTNLKIPEDIQNIILNIYASHDRYDASQAAGINEFVARVNSARRKSVVFVAVDDVTLPTIRFIAKQLRKLNYQTFGVYLIAPPPPDIYQVAICCQRSMNVLLSIIQGLSSRQTVYLQAHSEWAFLSIVMRAVNSELRIFQELYDWVSVFVEEENEEMFAKDALFDKKNLRLARFSENWIMHNTSGFLYKNVGPSFSKMLEASTSPYVKLYPCPPSEWMADNRNISKNRPWHLTFAGQIKSSGASEEVWSDINIIPIIQTVTRQNIKMSVYPVRVADDELANQVEYRDYYREQENNPNFTLERFKPIQELIQELSQKFHYGTLLFNIRKDLMVSREHTEGAMASKLFTYISAGLPVLISEELKYMADIISSHKIGLVLSYDDLNNLGDMLERVDYDELLRNVSIAQKKFCIDTQIGDILAFMNPQSSVDYQLL